MNHYERIVSYIHQYQGGVKGANVGYAKIEKRGEECRIQVQLRNGHLSRNPEIYLFRQLEGGIRAVSMGEMSLSGNEIFYKGNTQVEKLFGSDLSLEEIDGLLIYLSRDYYYATSWKNDSIHLGNWPLERGSGETAALQDSADGAEREGGEASAAEEPSGTQVIAEEDRVGLSGERESDGEGQKDSVPENRENMQENRADNILENREGKRGENREETERQEAAAAVSWEKDGKREEISQAGEENVCGQVKGTDGRGGEERGLEAAEAAQVQMQAICGVCPFKRQNMDYGKRILLSFPTMRPFPEERGSECVRLELQDIGCLPMKYWSLSGNRFLLHGYYCYRHLIFCHRGQGKYVLGVPGIYSDREQKNAFRFGFRSFQSIGEFGKQQGAFGYWLMELM